MPHNEGTLRNLPGAGAQQVVQVDRQREQRQGKRGDKEKTVFNPGAMFEPIQDVLGQQVDIVPGVGGVSSMFPGPAVSDIAALPGGGAANIAPAIARFLGRPSGPQEEPAGTPFADFDFHQWYQQKYADIDGITSMYQLFDRLQNEVELSPEAQAQIDALRADAGRRIAQINEEIRQQNTNLEAFRQINLQRRGQVQTENEALVDAISRRGGEGEAEIGRVTGEGLSNVRGIVDQSVANVLSRNPELAQTDTGGFLLPGGVESASKRAANQREAEEATRELESLYADSIAGAGGMTAEIARASSRVAEATVGLLDIQDQARRNRLETLLDNQVRSNVHNLVQNRQDIERNTGQAIAAITQEAEMARADNLAALDRLGIGVTADPNEAFFTAMIQAADDWLADARISLNPAQEQFFMGQLQAYAQTGGDNRLAVVADTARELGVDPERLATVFDRAVRAGSRRQFEMEDFVTDKYEPGSTRLGTLIFKSAQKIGVQPEAALILANSPSLHEIVRIQSGGRVASERGGNLKGLGGLPEDLYSEIGVSWEQAKNDPQLQMELLLTYILSRYDNPAAALRHFNDTKSFGDFNRIPSAPEREPGFALNPAATTSPGRGVRQ